MNKQPKVIEEITRHLEGYAHVERVILFGSRARGDEEERSDIDLAIEGPDITESDWRKIRDFIEEDARTLLSVDIMRVEHVSEKMRRSIAQEGVILYERSSNSALDGKPGQCLDTP